MERVFVLRTLDDRDGTWTVDVFADQAEAEKFALKALEGINRSDDYHEVNGELEEIPLPPWERTDCGDAIVWSPPEGVDWVHGGECVIWKAALDVPGPLADGDKVYAIWIDRFDVEVGVRDMVYTTKEAAVATVEEIIRNVGGGFTRHDDINEPGTIMWENWDADEEAGREAGDNQVIIWERPLVATPQTT